MRLFNREATEPEITDANPPEEVETEVAPEAVAEQPVEAGEPEYLSDEELDELYDENGEARWWTGDVPTDAAGNPIPATRPVPTTPPTPEPDVAHGVVPEETTAPLPAAPARPAFRSPFGDGLLNQQERERAEQLADPEVLSLIETMAMRAADKIVAVRDQQRSVTRDLGIPSHLHEEVASRMSAVEHLVPHELRGTKQGANAALALAAIQEAGDSGSVFDVMRRWSETPVVPQPSPAPAPQPVQAKKQTPFMAPSARTTVPRPAPDTVRSNRPTKTVGALPADAISVMQSERNTIKNGR